MVAPWEKFSPPLIWLFWKALMNTFPSDTVCSLKHHHRPFVMLLPSEHKAQTNFLGAPVFVGTAFLSCPSYKIFWVNICFQRMLKFSQGVFMKNKTFKVAGKKTQNIKQYQDLVA